MDEVLTLQYSSRTPTEIFQLIAFERHPPLFYWIEHVIISFGKSEFILRLVPAIGGIASIPAIYVLGREFMDRNTGILSAILMVFSPVSIYYSQEARMYSLLVLFTIITLIYYFRAIRTNEMKNWVFFGIFSTVLFWTDFYIVFAVGILFLHALIFHSPLIKRDQKTLKGIGVALVIFCVSCIPLLIAGSNLYIQQTGGNPPSWGTQGFNIIIEAISMMSNYSKVIGVLFLTLLVVGLYEISKKDKIKAIFLVEFLVIIFAISAYVSTKMDMNRHNLLFLLPAYFIGISGSYFTLSRIFHQKKVISIMIIVNAVLSVPFLSSYYNTYQKMDWRGVSIVLSATTQDGDYVMPIDNSTRLTLDYYYDPVADRTIELNSHSIATIKHFMKSNSGKRIIFILRDREQIPGGMTVPDDHTKEISELEQMGARKVAYVTGIHLLLLDMENPE